MRLTIPFIVISVLLLFGCSATYSVRETSTLQATTTLPSTETEAVFQNTPHLTNTPHPTNTGKEGGWPIIPTLDFITIPTSVPPLIAHEWQAETILVEFGHVWGGDGGWTIARGQFRPPPALILYSTGQLVLSVARDGPINSYRFDYYTTNLSRQESCQILNTLDQTGFLTFDNSKLHTLAMGAPGNYIKANAWQSSVIDEQALQRFVECINKFGAESNPGCGFITESTNWRAVVDTYNFLESFEPPRLEKYLPQEHVVWVDQPDYTPREINEWPYTSPSLKELALRQTCEWKGTPYTLEPNEVSIAWQLDPPAGFYEQDGFVLEVYSRPLLPHEIVLGCDESRPWPGIGIYVEELDTAQTMRCFPEDDVLPIPETPK